MKFIAKKHISGDVITVLQKTITENACSYYDFLTKISPTEKIEMAFVLYHVDNVIDNIFLNLADIFIKDFDKHIDAICEDMPYDKNLVKKFMHLSFERFFNLGYGKNDLEKHIPKWAVVKWCEKMLDITDSPSFTIDTQLVYLLKSHH